MKKFGYALREMAGIIPGGIIGAAITGVPEVLIHGRELFDEKLFEEEFNARVGWTCANGAVTGVGVAALAALVRGMDKKGVPNSVAGLSVLLGTSLVAFLMYRLRESEEGSMYSYEELHEDGLFGFIVEKAIEKFDTKQSSNTDTDE